MSFSELYLIYYPKLVRFAKEFVMSEEDAENITQDVFTDLWEKRESMNHIENMNAYLFRLVRNKCLDYLKHKVFEQKSDLSATSLLKADAGVIFHLHYLAIISFLFNPLLSIEHESKATLNATKLHEK